MERGIWGVCVWREEEEVLEGECFGADLSWGAASSWLQDPKDRMEGGMPPPAQLLKGVSL